ncbi:Alpha/Beta hydrolase protein [Mycena galopus ATCC 62051]|nr:Alpha/Beta hydrolase protein [Mycena galopus ATCC 62051]
MPRIALDTKTGSETFHYTISTPTDVSAAKIVQGLPTLFLIHPVHMMSLVFHPIYEDPRLRRLNLVAMNLRGHGWTSAKVEDTYGIDVATQDILTLMDALGISSCHVVGVCMGATVALQLAMVAPEKVMSLFLFAPPSVPEPAESIEGREEIHECWKQGFQHKDRVDDATVADAKMGGSQMAYNNKENRLCSAVTGVSLEAAKRNWGCGDFDVMLIVTVKYLLKQEPYSVSAAPFYWYTANIDAKLSTIEGAAHSGNMTHAKETNALLYDFLLANSSSPDLPPIPKHVQSPFLEELVAVGLFDDEDSDDSD